MRRFHWTPGGWRRVNPAGPSEGVGGDFELHSEGERCEMDVESRREVIMEYLREEGYVPKIDDDGDVMFKCEGRTYYVILDASDEQFYRLVFPNFWSIDDDAERSGVVAAAQAATAKTKVAKVFPVKDDTWASIELFLPNPESFTQVFSRSMSALRAVVQSFRDAMEQ